MAQFETPITALPVPTKATPQQSLLRRAAPEIGFLSQLIAERYHLATQRARRQAPVPTALDTYAGGAKRLERRLPPGYRMSRDA